MFFQCMLVFASIVFDTACPKLLYSDAIKVKLRLLSKGFKRFKDTMIQELDRCFLTLSIAWWTIRGDRIYKSQCVCFYINKTDNKD